MAKRFHAETTTIKGIDYTVEIYDSDFVGTSTEFTLGADGFTLRYDGQPKRYQAFNPSTLEFSFKIQNATHQGIIDDIRAAAEQQFQIKVLREGSFYWCGNVIPDESRDTDLSYPYEFRINAVDGLGYLKDIPYNNSGTAYTGEETFLGHIVNCLDKTGLLNFGWAASTECIQTADNWYEDDMTTGAAQDPLTLSRVKHRVFYDVDSKGEKIYMSCLDVLEQVLQVHLCNLKLSNGVWRIYQIDQMALSTLTHVRKYDRDGVYLSSSSAVDITTTFNQNEATGAKAGGNNQFGAFPALRNVTITYRAKNWRNYLEGNSWNSTTSNLITLDGDIDHNSGNTLIRITGNIAQTLQNVSYSDDDPVFIIYKITVKVGTKYLRRNILGVNNFNVSYAAPGWTTNSANRYYIAYPVGNGPIPSVGSTQPVPGGHFDIQMPPLQESGECQVQIEWHDTRKQVDGSSVSAGVLAITWNADNVYMTVLTSGDGAVDMDDKLYEALNTNGSTNSETLDFETLIGDGTNVNSLGKIEVYDGAAWNNSSFPQNGWQVGGTGTKYNICNLIAQQLIAGQKTPIRRYHGNFYGVKHAHSRVDDNNSDSVWILTNASYAAVPEWWSGDYFEIVDSPTDINVLDPVAIEPGRIPIIGTGPTSGNVLGPPSGVVGSGGVTPVPGATSNLTSATTSNLITSGTTITSIAVSQTLVDDAFVDGQQIWIYNPVTNHAQQVEVAADVADSDTSISIISTTAEDDFPPGSFIVDDPKNYTVKNYGATPSLGGVTDHGALTGLGDDDHSWALNINGRAGGQTAIGGSAAGEDLTLESTSDVTKGNIIIKDAVELQSFSGGAPTTIVGRDSANKLASMTIDSSLTLSAGQLSVTTPAVTDHGALSGLGDDDHAWALNINGRAGGQTAIGGTAAGEDLTLESTSNVTKGNIIIKDAVELQSFSGGTSTAIVGRDSANKISSVTLGDMFTLDSGTLKAHQYITLSCLPLTTAVTQTAGYDYENAHFVVPQELDGWNITYAAYKMYTNTATTGSLKLELVALIGPGTYSINIHEVTFTTGTYYDSTTGSVSVSEGDLIWCQVDPSTSGTLNGSQQGLSVTFKLEP